MGEGFAVRRAGAGDVEVLIRFNRAMAEETEQRTLSEATVTAGVRAVLSDPAAGFYLLALDDNEPVASLMITTEWSDWRNGTFWWIQSVYVAPTYRRRGAYRALYDHVRRLAGEAGDVCGFRLYVERENTGARRVYETLGMIETPYRLYEAPL